MLRLTELKLENNIFNCSCDIRWIQLWQEREEANLQNQDLYCTSMETSHIPIQELNINQCDQIAPLPMQLGSACSKQFHNHRNVGVGVYRVVITVPGNPKLLQHMSLLGSYNPDYIWKTEKTGEQEWGATNANWTNVHSINLTLVNVTSEDNGFLLTCIAENVVGMSNASVLLTVYSPPRILSLLEPIRHMEHCIEFSVHGNPPPQIHWLYNGQFLRQTAFIRMDVYQGGDITDGCLLFNHPTHYNNGNYTIVATNSLGTANQTVRGHFLEKPFPSIPDIFVTYEYSPSPSPLITVTHKPEEDTFGLSTLSTQKDNVNHNYCVPLR
ncbi:hypothetical protein E2320_013503 [Naja naja]|nr:hypothetical protein E2320_013503 [Naja naja]